MSEPSKAFKVYICVALQITRACNLHRQKGGKPVQAGVRKLRMQQRSNNTYCVFLPPVINCLLQYFDRDSTCPCPLLYACHLLKVDAQVKLNTEFLFLVTFITSMCTIKSQNSSVFYSGVGYQLWGSMTLSKIWMEFDMQRKFCNNPFYTQQLVSHTCNWINQNRLGVPV